MAVRTRLGQRTILWLIATSGKGYLPSGRGGGGGGSPDYSELDFTLKKNLFCRRIKKLLRFDLFYLLLYKLVHRYKMNTDFDLMHCVLLQTELCQVLELSLNKIE